MNGEIKKQKKKNGKIGERKKFIGLLMAKWNGMGGWTEHRAKWTWTFNIRTRIVTTYLTYENNLYGYGLFRVRFFFSLLFLRFASNEMNMYLAILFSHYLFRFVSFRLSFSSNAEAFLIMWRRRRGHSESNVYTKCLKEQYGLFG